MCRKGDRPFTDSFDSLGAVLRVEPTRLVLDQARATRAFERRLSLTGEARRPVEFLSDALACCRAAYGMAWAEMEDRAPLYAAAAAVDARRAQASFQRDPPPSDALGAVAEKAVDREFFLDGRHRGLGPPYGAVSEEARVDSGFRRMLQKRGIKSLYSFDDRMVTRARAIADRWTQPSHVAYAPIRAALAAEWSEEPNSNWVAVWDMAWWAAWDAPAAAEARRLTEESYVAVAEERAAVAASDACRRASLRAWSQASDFAFTAVVRSPEFVAPQAVERAVLLRLAERAGHDLDKVTLSFEATYIEPCLAGVYLYFMTPSAVLCAPWPR